MFYRDEFQHIFLMPLTIWVQADLRTTDKSLYFQSEGKVNDSSKGYFHCPCWFVLHGISLFLAEAILLKATIDWELELVEWK